MSTPIDNGGPAFPLNMPPVYREHATPCYEAQAGASGMTLRDWFAGQAIVGLANQNELKDKDLARFAYVLADEMLSARKNKGGVIR